MKINTDYKIDQYIYYSSSSATAAAGGGFSVNRLPHGLPYTPLIYVQWAETSDFSTPRELWQNSGDTYPVAEPWVISADADATDIGFLFQNWGTSSKTLYYRVWAFPQHDSTADVPYTSGVTGFSNLIINSDMNYLKLLSANKVLVGSSTNVVVDHGLGYLPVVMIWREWLLSIPTIEPLFSPVAASTLPFESTPYVTDTQIVFPSNGFSDQIFHYRIYLDNING